MESDDPISEWLKKAKADDADAQQELFTRYVHRVIGLARKVLGAGPQSGGGAEDVAQSVLRTFFIRARTGKFPHLEKGEELWPLLAEITVRKALKRRRKEDRHTKTDMELINEIFDEKPSPEADADIRDDIALLYKLLDHDPDAQRVLALKLEGYTNTEIMKITGFYRAKIGRKLQLIRETWNRELRRRETNE